MFFVVVNTSTGKKMHTVLINVWMSFCNNFLLIKTYCNLIVIFKVVTGLLRRLKGDTSLTEHLPIGILPLGRTNNVAKQLLKPEDDNQVHFLTNATMTIINEMNSALPVIKIENLLVFYFY